MHGAHGSRRFHARAVTVSRDCGLFHESLPLFGLKPGAVNAQGCHLTRIQRFKLFEHRISFFLKRRKRYLVLAVNRHKSTQLGLHYKVTVASRELVTNPLPGHRVHDAASLKF